MQRLRIDLIAAARPNFMKVAPLFHALHAQPWCRLRLVHTGQHYDQNMSEAFFRDLGLPSPNLHLGIGSGSHAEQTANVMLAYEGACVADRPDLIVVVGDVNATLACALVGAKLYISVAHLEAGLRSRDRNMPEEINRLVTDTLADILWTPSPDADENLAAEGVAPDKVTRVGNIMIDSYELMRERIDASGERCRLGLEKREYAVVTLHRPSNVDAPAPLTSLVSQLKRIAARLPLVFPVHPRTRKNLEAFGLWTDLAAASGVQVVEPLGYVDFMNLVCGDHRQHLGQPHPDHLNFFVRFRIRRPLANVPRQVDAHRLAQKARTRKVLRQVRPPFRPVACLLNHLALCRRQRSLARLNPSRRQLQQKLPRRMAILPLQNNLRVTRVLRFIDRQDHNRPVMPNHVACIHAPAARLLHRLREHGKHLALVRHLRRKQPGFTRGFLPAGCG